MGFTKMDYCQFLLSSQVNYTLTHLAEHLHQFSHDTINRYLKGQKLTPQRTETDPAPGVGAGAAPARTRQPSLPGL